MRVRPLAAAAILLLAGIAAVATLVTGPEVSRPVAAASLIRLVDAYPGVAFDQPLYAVQPPDGTPRMFVAEQGGRIWIVDHPAPAPPAVASKRLFLDLSDKVSHSGNEEGLLGLAFHPKYATNRRLFVHYTSKYATSSERKGVVAELKADAQDADTADAASERTVLQVTDPYSNHNGGWLGFGKDGMLFVAMGDGGSGGDPANRSQDLGSLFGKILRIDVDAAGGNYGTPADNPFVARSGARPEVWAYGLRNPWRCSFDRVTGDLWTGDVGQDAWEEVDRVVKGGNYGWRRREGKHAYDGSGPAPDDPLVEPLAEYARGEGTSVTGGYVYRGDAIPGLDGSYLYADFASGRIWALEDAYDAAHATELLDTDEQISSFAEDRTGELYITSFRGRVLRIENGGPPAAPVLPPTLSELNLFRNLRTLEPVAGALRYDVIVPLWADGASKSRFLVIPSGGLMEWGVSDSFGLPPGGFAVKTFRRGGERIETRVIRGTTQGFIAATYRWRSDHSDADRVDERTTATAGGGTWTFPSPDDCRTCHLPSAGFLIGTTTRQLRAGTIRKWARLGVLDGAPPPSQRIARNVGIRSAAPAGARVRSYLDANCAYCHQAEEANNASLHLEGETALADTGIFDKAPQHGDFGLEDARIVAPGRPESSTLVHRMKILGEGRMPQVGTSRVDKTAVRMIERWIRRLR